MNGIESAVRKLMNRRDGHGFDHVQRVRDLAVQFAYQEKANILIVSLASLLHDVDDYKLFGEENAKNLTNARRILENNKVDSGIQAHVVDIISNMGYSKFLNGVRPKTLEGKIVSDADMCDSIGAEGILRTHAYNLSKGSSFFDKNLEPLRNSKTMLQYRNIKTDHAVQHFFDKLLKINNILMTSSGKKEGAKRQKIMIDFLTELFREEHADSWSKYLQKYLKKSKN